jgi:hypothetical protein
LRLAIELDDNSQVERYLAHAQSAIQRNKDPAFALLLHAVVQSSEDLEARKDFTLAALEGYSDHWVLLHSLYLLAGLRLEARETAQRLVAEFLDPPASLTARFRDRPKLREWYERYRPFAEGRSHGAGDPSHRKLFCS